MTIKNKKSGHARPAMALGVMLLIASAVGGFALNFVKYSDNDYWSDSAIVVPAITVSGAVTGGSLAISEGAFSVVNTTQLVFIASGVTNVIDADITSE